MNRREEFYIHVCDCGRVHAESRHFRLSFHPAEFVALLRQVAENGSLNGGHADRRLLVSAEDRAKPGDTGVGTIVCYPFPQGRFYGASHVD